MADDRYEFLEPIGTGGMAVVWEARDRALGRPVAIKRLLPHLASDPSAAARFRREARASAGLTHPGIVTVYDTGEDDEGPYIVLELVEGRTLADRLNESPIAPSEVANIVARVAEALDHAHAQGVIHRDIKPSNLILEDDGRVRLTDFGIAKTVEDPTKVTTQDVIVGTISYMAPEILQGETASPASDIYSLAAVTHEMLTGAPPFRADHLGALLEAIRAGEAAPLAGVPAGMADTVRRAMSTDPADRPRSAGAFASDVIADDTAPIEPSATLPLPISPAGSDEPTLVLSGSGPTSEGSETAGAGSGQSSPGSSRYLLLGVSMIVVALLVWAAMARGPTAATGTSLPSATFASSSADDSTSTSTATSTSTTVPTTLSETPETVTEAIYGAIDGLRPPEFHPREVSRLEESLDQVTEEWNRGDEDDLRKALEKFFERVDGLPDSEQRDEISALAVQLAEAMGFQLDGTGDDDD